jgi:hypothetical protein
MRRKSLALFTRPAFLPYPERNDRSWASVCENRRVSDVSILQREMYSEAEAARLLRVTRPRRRCTTGSRARSGASG